GFSGCDALDPAGVARIAGLEKYNLFAQPLPFTTQAIIDASAMKRCPLTGFGALPGDPPGAGFVWEQGTILMGGGKSDILEGRGNDDIIDGDHSLNVYISVRQSVDVHGLPTGLEIARVRSLEEPSLGVAPGQT